MATSHPRPITLPLAALLSFANRTLDRMLADEGWKNYVGALLADREEFRSNREAHAAIHDACKIFAYQIAAREIWREPEMLDRQAQVAFLRELQGIAQDNATFLLVAQGFQGICNPAQAMERDEEKALSAHFYIVPNTAGPDGGPGTDAEAGIPSRVTAGIPSRVTLSVKTASVIDVTKQLLTEFDGEFSDLLRRMKVLAANEHGRSPDNIVLFLRRLHPMRAKQFARHLSKSLPGNVWEKPSPLGMHAFLPGIAYGESLPDSMEGFATDRCLAAADAILMHLTEGKRLDDAMTQALSERNFSLEDPAFVERPSLRDFIKHDGAMHVAVFAGSANM